MQVNTQNIQRPSLFSDFFGLELLWNNEYLTYIKSGIEIVTSHLHKTVKTSVNNIKNSLNKSEISNTFNRSIDNELLKYCPLLGTPESRKYIFVHSGDNHLFFIKVDYSQHEDYYKIYDDFSIFNPQPLKGASSLV